MISWVYLNVLHLFSEQFGDFGMKLIVKNKKAFFNYEIFDTYEAGIVLTGGEVKSIRAGHISLDESFANVHQGEVFLVNCHIAPYSHEYEKKDSSRRSRKLLLHKREIDKIMGDVSRKGYTLVPLRMYFSRGNIKVEIGMGKHKKAAGKKRELKERDIKRETEREIKGTR